MRWRILGAEERSRIGQFVAVAVAGDDMTATLVRDYLRTHGVAANFPPVTYIFRVIPEGTHIWVHYDDEADALGLLRQLEMEWYTES
ncbi:MAG: hypothetical protein WHS44_11205 [Fimbriimonadales bacterium]|nr:MAG: hypothetical protein KatS3mg018_0119 [Fimbriimonadales bacterium]